MKIVILSPEAVYPVNTGGRVVVYNRIKYFRQNGFDIDLVCIVDSDEEALVQEEAMGALGVACCSVNRNRHKLLNMVKALFLPYAAASRSCAAVRKKVDQLVSGAEGQYIFVESPQMLGNVSRKASVRAKIVLNQQNIEFESMRSLGRTQKHFYKRAIFYLDSLRLELYEKRYYHKKMISAMSFVSTEDKKYFDEKLNVNGIPTMLVPIGAESHEPVDIRRNPNNVVIVGKMSYAPNIEGVLWFMENVWGSVKKAVPDAHLYIVGKDPDQKICEYAGTDITVTGTVDSVEGYYAMASAAVIPLFSGGGVKTKLIEAASYRVPIVCTSSGAKGTEFKDKEHILVADEPGFFADCVIEALRNKDASVQRAEECYGFFARHYQWDGIIKGFMDDLSHITQ